MGVVELRDCECRAAGKIGAGRYEAKRVQRDRDGSRLIRCWWLGGVGWKGVREGGEASNIG
jgi:hypothetical protein